MTTLDCLTNIDLTKLIEESNDIIQLSKKNLTPEQRRFLTCYADKKGYATFIQKNNTANNEDIMIISKQKEFSQKEFVIDYESAQKRHIMLFSYYFNVPIFVDDYAENLKYVIEKYKLEEKWKMFVDEIARYGYSGMKRRDEILQQYIIDILKNTSEYKQHVENKPKMLKLKYGSLSKAKIFNELYQKHSCVSVDESLVWLSIDAKNAVFQGFRDIGVIKEQKWEDFISNFTKSDVLKNSKQFRLEIFGNVNNPMKCNQILITNSIIKIWNILCEKAPIVTNIFVILEGDEILLKTNKENCKMYYNIINETIINNNMSHDTKIEAFQIEDHYLKSGKIFFVKRFFDMSNDDQRLIKLNRFDIKCVDPINRLEAFELIN